MGPLKWTMKPWGFVTLGKKIKESAFLEVKLANDFTYADDFITADEAKSVYHEALYIEVNLIMGLDYYEVKLASQVRSAD